MTQLKARTTLLCLAALTSVAYSQVNTLPGTPYMAKNATRYYFLTELDFCPGVLDMQTGDLWTITFPENISNYYLTRPGVIEAKAQDNRLILTPLTNNGTVPLLVITENNLAPKFLITIKSGAGGRLKDIQIISGSSAKSTCPVSAAPRATEPVSTRNTLPTKVPAVMQQPAPIAPVIQKPTVTMPVAPKPAPPVPVLQSPTTRVTPSTTTPAIQPRITNTPTKAATHITPGRPVMLADLIPEAVITSTQSAVQPTPSLPAAPVLTQPDVTSTNTQNPLAAQGNSQVVLP